MNSDESERACWKPIVWTNCAKREKDSVGDVRVLHVPSTRQLADIFTKGLPTALFEDFRSNLCVPVPNAAIEGG